MYDTAGSIDLDILDVTRLAATRLNAETGPQSALAHAIASTISEDLPVFSNLPEDMRQRTLAEQMLTFGYQNTAYPDSVLPLADRLSFFGSAILTNIGPSSALEFPNVPHVEAFFEAPEQGVIRDYILVSPEDFPEGPAIAEAIAEYDRFLAANTIEGIPLSSFVPEIGVLMQQGFPFRIRDYLSGDTWVLVRVAEIGQPFFPEIAHRWLSFLELDWRRYER